MDYYYTKDKLTGFADDTVTLCEGENWHEVKTIIETDFAKAPNWFSQNTHSKF